MTRSLFHFVFLVFTLNAAPLIALDLVTTREDGSQFGGGLWGYDLSEDGNLVVFSTEEDLLPEDTNGLRDVYLKDRTTRELFLISKTGTGIAGNGNSDNPRISADGNLIVYASQATNLILSDTNGATDVFLFDRDGDTTTRVSVDASGSEISGISYGPNISADGTRVMFVSNAPLIGTDTNGWQDVFLRTLANPATLRLATRTPTGDAGTGISYVPSLSRDGRYVSFWYQGATDLATTDTDGNTPDVYRYDGMTETVFHVSKNAAGTASGNGSATHASMSADGSLISYRCTSTDVINDDTDSLTDIYVYDFTMNSTFLASVNSAGEKANGDCSSGPHALSADGEQIVFTSSATNLGGQSSTEAHLYLRDFAEGETTSLTDTSDGNGPDSLISSAQFSTDGESILFSASATNLVNDDEFGEDSDLFAYPGTDLTVDPSVAINAAIAAANAAKKSKLRRQLSKLKKKLRSARRGGKAARIKSLKRQISKKKRAIRKL